MADFSLDDLTTPVTRAEAQASIYDVLALLGVNTTSWKSGGVLRAMVVACSAIFAALSTLQAKIARMGFLELSEGPWLTLVARYVYGVERIEASFASGELTLTNAGGGVYTLDPGDLIAANPDTGKTYRNTSAFTLGALATLTVAIRATEAGADSSAEGDTITEITAPPMLGVTCTNAMALIGADEERDPALRARCSETLGAVSPFGPWDAYASAARSAKRADGTPVGVTRTRLAKDGFGNVTVYVATASGTVSGTTGDLGTDLGVVDEAVQRYAAPQSVNATTISAAALAIPVTYELWLYNTSGKTVDEIKTAVALRLAEFASGQPVGGNIIGSDPGKVFADAVRTAIGASLTQVFHVVVTQPAGDVTLSVGQVPTIGTVTATAIHQEAPPEGYGA